MHPRSRSREEALKILYLLAQHDRLRGGDSYRRGYLQVAELPARVRAYAERLVAGVSTNLEWIDGMIVEVASHWDPERMSLVDRNVLRLAVYEMAFEADVPAAVSINEAIELAKRFGGPESGAFVNGILDTIHRRLTAGGAGSGEDDG